jgi:hypothetical protein
MTTLEQPSWRIGGITVVAPRLVWLALCGSSLMLVIRIRTMYVYIRCIEARLCNHCCSGKAIIVTFSGCAEVALIVQHAPHIHRIILLSVACPTAPYFSKLSYKRHDFRKKKFLDRYDVCFDFICNLCLKHFSFEEDFNHTLTLIFM